MTKLLLLDSNSLINRAFYALPPMQTKDGLFTNAVYGYVSMLNKLINEEKPTHICAVFDCHAKTFRHLKYDQYKAGRKPMPEELVMQVPVLQKLLETMGIKLLFKEGIEADDIIGTLAKRFSEETIIVSGDRDVLQLVDETTTVFHTKRGVTDIIRYDREKLKEEGFLPEQIIEYKALAGDSSDNIPGCKGVGEKTAKDLLAQYENVEGIYKNIDQIKGKLREKLESDKENVYLSKDLATIETKADVECTLNDLVFNTVLPERAKEMMESLEFRKLTDRFVFDGNIVEESPKTEKKDFFRVETTSFDEAKTILDKVKKGDKICIDYAHDITISFDDTTLKFPIAEGLFGTGLTEDEAVTLLKPFFGTDYINIFFDAKKEKYRYSSLGIDVEKPYEDVLLQAYLVNNTKVIKDGPSLLTDYGFSDETPSESYLQLHEMLSEKLKQKNLTELYKAVELPLIECLYDMEKEGLTVDMNVLSELDETFSKEIEKLTGEIHTLAGEDFNINSPKQLSDILFGKLGLKASKKNKTGYSVSADVLEELEHPIIDALLRYRQLSKLKSTYIDGMKQVMSKATNRVHTDFKQCLTATGRLSSNEPNLQNIPVRTSEGREIRKIFVAKEGNILLSADYSQIELRLLAHLSQEPRLIESYHEGIDVHSLTASKIFKTPLEEVTPQMRRSAKAVNFGIIYGISGFGLAKNAGVSNKQAKIFIDDYFETYPMVKKYMTENVELAKKQGYLTTLLGRIRYFPELTSPQFNTRSFGERAAMNFPLQGSASDIIKVAMLRVYDALKKGNYRSKLILQVHDELILECPEDEKDEVISLVRENMENAFTLRVPLPVGISYGRNWYDAK